MPGIFISYRRDDSAAEASHLYADLSEHFGEDLVFRDIYTLEPGADYVEALERFADSCDVLVTLIGRRWLTATDAKGRRRLDDPEDLHRLEIATALRRNVRVIPVLLQGATMPGPEDLPGDLVKLVRRNAYEISDSRWRYDVGRLIQALERIVTADGPTSRRPSVGADRPRAEPTREPAPPEPDAVISPAPRPVAARGRRSALVPVLIAAALLAVVGGWLVAPSLVDRPSPTPTAAPAKPTQAQPTAAPEVAAAQPAEAPKPTAAQPTAAPATAAPAPTQPPPTATTAPATPPAQANPTEAAKPEPTRSPVDPILLALVGPLTVAPTSPVTGQTVEAGFTVENAGGQPVSVAYILAGARDPGGANVDFPASEAVTLEPGRRYTYRRSRAFTRVGTYTAWPAYYDGSTWVELGPRTQFTVNDPGPLSCPSATTLGALVTCITGQFGAFSAPSSSEQADFRAAGGRRLVAHRVPGRLAGYAPPGRRRPGQRGLPDRAAGSRAPPGSGADGHATGDAAAADRRPRRRDGGRDHAGQ